MGMQNALTAGMSRHTSLYVIAALTMIEAVVFSIVFGITLDDIDDNRRIVGLQEKVLKISAVIIIGTYLIAFVLSFGLMFGAAKKKPGWLKVFFIFGIVKCILKVAVATIFINGRIIVAAGVLVIICAVLNTYFIAIIAATEKEMKKLLNSPIATAPVVASNPQHFVGNQEGLQAPYNPGHRPFGNNDYPVPPSYNQPFGSPPSYFSENEAPPLSKK